MRRSIIRFPFRILIPAVLIAAAAVSLVGRLFAAPVTRLLDYPSATTVSGCGLVYTANGALDSYVWPCVIFRNGVDP